MKPRLLDLFCGAGGAAVGYARAGFEVVGVDHVDQPNYPFEFHRGDALDLDGLLHSEDFYIGDFDAIHTSPPCQAHSTLKARTKHIDHPELIEPTRELLEATGLPYVIENVVTAPLRNPIQICGSGLNLGVQRHRLFETNFPLMGIPCSHGGQPARFDVYEHGRWYRTPFAKVYGSGGGKAMEHWAWAMGINWMTPAEMKEAIPPAYTEHVGGFLHSYLKQRKGVAA